MNIFMARLESINRFRCRTCGTITTTPNLLTAPSPFCANDTLMGCPACRQCDEGFDLLCDEPGCNAQASCGWPTGSKDDSFGGYRNTCLKHAKKD